MAETVTTNDGDGFSERCRQAVADCEVCRAPDGWRFGSHYHCARCGEVCGMMAHYAGEGKPWTCDGAAQEAAGDTEGAAAGGDGAGGRA